jgi:hypothetical protein
LGIFIANTYWQHYFKLSYAVTKPVVFRQAEKPEVERRSEDEKISTSRYTNGNIVVW